MGGGLVQSALDVRLGRRAGEQPFYSAVGSLEWVCTERLDGMDPRWAGDRPHVHRLGEGLHATARQSSAPDLDDEVVETMPAGPQIGHDLVSDRLPTLYGQAVLVALAGEGQRAGVDLLAKPDVGGITGHAWRAWAHDQVAQAPDDGGVGVDRDEHPQTPAAGGGHHGRGQSGVATTGYRQVRPGEGTGQPQAVGDLEVQEHTHEVPALVGAGDVAGLVLDPHPSAALEAQGPGEVLAALERRGHEPVPVDGGDRHVEALDQGEEVLIGHAARYGAVVAVQEAPVPGERLGAHPAVRGEAQDGRVEGPHQDVVDVTLAGAGTAEGVRVVEVRRTTATGTDEAARRSRHGTRTPLRELNSLIISSHTGSFPRSSDQKDASRLATKSSNERPCCSTQVK